MPDRDTFKNGSALNCNCVVGMCSNDREGTKTNQIQFVLAVV